MSRGRHARDGQRRDAIAAWLASLPARAELAIRWCHWRLIAHPRYARALRAALHEAVRGIPDTPVTPAPDRTPGQAPRPADPPGEARCGPGQPLSAAEAIGYLMDDLAAGRLAPRSPGAVADGTGTDAGAVPSPAAGATPPPRGGPATLPHPLPVPPSGTGMGQHLPWVITQPPPGSPLGYQPVSRPEFAILPDKKVAVTERGQASIRGLGWEGHARETGAQAALVRPAARRRFEHVDDAARWTA